MWVIRRLYQFIFQFPRTFLFGSVFFIVGMSLSNITPFFLKWITESVQAGQYQQTWQYIMLFGGLLLLANSAENLGYYITDKNMVATSTLISHTVLKHIHDLDFAFHTNKSSGKLISLMKRGDEGFFTFYDILNRQFLYIALSYLVMLGAFTQLAVTYVVFVILLVSLSFALSWFLVKINIRKRNLFNDADDEISSARVDNLVNFDTVKYFANEKFEQQRFGSLLETWNQTLQGYFFTFRYFDVVLGNMVNIALVGLLLLAFNDLTHNHISLAQFLLVTSFALTLSPKMMHFLFSLRDLAKKYSDLEKYFAVLQEEISVADPIDPAKLPTTGSTIKFENVRFAYDDRDQNVLDDVSLTIKTGEAVALVGYSGSGKTTLAKLLMRMYDPTSGRILINDTPINSVTKAELRSAIGIVPQDPLLFNNTIYYNIAYSKDNATKKQVYAAAEAAKVTEFVKILDKGYETIVGERGIKLSGGQRQRLAIARILLRQPRILVLDEATSALDSASEKSIQAAFWKLVRDTEQPRTAIIIAHRLSTIMQADRIIVLDKGKIAEEGTHEQLLKNKQGIYSKLWSLQKDGFIGDGESENSLL